MKKTVLIASGKPEVKWFIEGEPGNEPTNELVAREVSSECAHEDVLCADGKKHNLWECTSFDEVRAFLTYRRTANFVRLTVWMQIGDAKPQRWNLLEKAGKVGSVGRKVKKSFSPRASFA